MILTTRGRYAVTAMLDLALHAPSRPVTLAEIAERQSISLSYLEQIFSRLRRAGLVKSHRGPGGGYELIGSPAEISIAHVIGSVHEDMDATLCGGSSDCHDGARCITHDLWTGLSAHIEAYLSAITLQQLVSPPSLPPADAAMGAPTPKVGNRRRARVQSVRIVGQLSAGQPS